MVIHKAEQVLSAVEAPLFAAELPLQGVADLKEIHCIQAGVEPFAAFIVCHAMAHVVAHDLVVIAADHLAHEEKVGF